MALKGLSLGSPIIGNEANYAAAFATDIAGFRSVPTVADLYNIKAYILSHSGNNTNNDAIGQVWRVTNDTTANNNGDYRLTDWSKHGEAGGWQKVTSDTSISSDLSTMRSAIDKITDTNGYLKATNPTYTAASRVLSFANNKGTNNTVVLPLATDSNAGLMSNTDKAITDKAITGVTVSAVNDNVDNVLSLNHNNSASHKIGFIQGITIKDNSDNAGVDGYSSFVSLDNHYFPSVLITCTSNDIDENNSFTIVDVIDPSDTDLSSGSGPKLNFNPTYFSITNSKINGESSGIWRNGEMTLKDSWVKSLATATALNTVKTTAEAAKGVTDTLNTNGYLKASGATYTASSRTLSFPNSNGTNTNIVLPVATNKVAGLMDNQYAGLCDTLLNYYTDFAYNSIYSIWNIKIINVAYSSYNGSEDTLYTLDNFVYNQYDKKLLLKETTDKYYDYTVDFFDNNNNRVFFLGDDNKLYKPTFSNDAQTCTLTEISPANAVSSFNAMTTATVAASTTDVTLTPKLKNTTTGATTNGTAISLGAASTTKAGVMTSELVTELKNATTNITNITNGTSGVTKLTDDEIKNAVTAGWA